jgi:hypothetical protein
MLMVALTVELGIRQHQGDGHAPVGGPRRAVWSTISGRSTVHLSQWRPGKSSPRLLARFTKKVLIAPGARPVTSTATVAW